MNFEEMEARIRDLVAKVEQSAANHHILVGVKMEAERAYAEAKANVVGSGCNRCRASC